MLARCQAFGLLRALSLTQEKLGREGQSTTPRWSHAPSQPGEPWRRVLLLTFFSFEALSGLFRLDIFERAPQMGMQRQAEQALFLREAGAINKDHMADKGGRCHLKRPLLRAEVVLGIVLKALQEVLDFFFFPNSGHLLLPFKDLLSTSLRNSGSSQQEHISWHSFLVFFLASFISFLHLLDQKFSIFCSLLVWLTAVSLQYNISALQHRTHEIARR